MLRLLALFFSYTLALSACAQPAPAASDLPGNPKVGAGIDQATAKKVSEVMASGMPGSSDIRLNPSPIPGFVEVTALVNSGQGVRQTWTVLQISNDGKLVIDGAIFDADSAVNLVERSLDSVRAEELRKLAPADRIVFKAANEKHRLIVFTNTKCTWCRVLHRNIDEYNKLGITVEYLPFPMSRNFAGVAEMNQVWCAKDRHKAITDAKNDRPVDSKECRTPVLMGEDVGYRIGVGGTPAYYLEDGRKVSLDARDPAGALSILDSLQRRKAK